ncbi:PIN/TRAM domain-containing protein [Anaerosalibacter bizertensis]|uniref:PIN/TRAM domain-containing protein n=1 Tax=Anaerosalibacter bizertensis TaxID=932217 RepID=A0A9Q4ABH7_9FIRM|nr:PIN/TRAM domain-containing protein [Anaerosalibacter bizertensis]MBV1816759.1 PIN/TRAM domain-containing protein [Bacteroidales bacterium MSK.15.36]MCB5560395.1 PIN/TRAM domain-containing protein [Anaerosalibacter bizertensis]MCG4564389.1 PIN/TRAM domain-containing protein [Anaerosalibacter bizertensis]MCG4582511.1 PIN/TRAM domain-containing protein [Anaerosalibacter bizertensis]MCG4584851.1 PIN/TRAM domain-containing protein [Anaerosalibacter bizertensis]
MADKIARYVIALIGTLIGYGVMAGLKSIGILNLTNMGILGLVIFISMILISGIIFFFLSPSFIKGGRKFIRFVEVELQDIPASDIALGSIGLIVGLIIAYLLSQPFYNLNVPYLGVIVSILLYLIFGYLGIKIPTRKIEDFTNTFSLFKRNTEKEKLKAACKACPKILDTSVIIDGRVADICKTGFIEGPLIIPEFVLEELQHIADSSDSLKRNRGRRGLDILNKIQKELDVEVIITDKKYDDIKEVDSKLLKLTQDTKGKIITNDYNLNKVAEVQKIDVLNINELANAIKPVVLPGEEMRVQVIKDGKESGQGLAYLDDGTMIVVEGGKKHIGETIIVLVTSVLQTSAGRMIFAKPKSAVDRAV